MRRSTLRKAGPIEWQHIDKSRFFLWGPAVFSCVRVFTHPGACCARDAAGYSLRSFAWHPRVASCPRDLFHLHSLASPHSVVPAMLIKTRLQVRHRRQFPQECPANAGPCPSA